MTKITTYILPHGAPAYGPPPYHMVEAKILMVNYPIDEAVAKSMISPPLEFVKGTMASIFIGDMLQIPHCGSFHEGGVIVRAKSRQFLAPYMPYLWTSTDEAMMVGREIYGMPKVLCDDDTLKWSGNQLIGRIRRRGQDVMSVEVNIENRIDPATLGLVDRRLAVRTLPDLCKPGYSRREVLHFDLGDYTIAEAWEGRASVNLFRTAFSNVHELQPPAGELRGYYLRASWTLDKVFVREVIEA